MPKVYRQLIHDKHGRVIDTVWYLSNGTQIRGQPGGPLTYQGQGWLFGTPNQNAWGWIYHVPDDYAYNPGNNSFSKPTQPQGDSLEQQGFNAAYNIGKNKDFEKVSNQLEQLYADYQNGGYHGHKQGVSRYIRERKAYPNETWENLLELERSGQRNAADEIQRRLSSHKTSVNPNNIEEKIAERDAYGNAGYSRIYDALNEGINQATREKNKPLADYIVSRQMALGETPWTEEEQEYFLDKPLLHEAYSHHKGLEEQQQENEKLGRYIQQRQRFLGETPWTDDEVQQIALNNIRDNTWLNQVVAHHRGIENSQNNKMANNILEGLVSEEINREIPEIAREQLRLAEDDEQLANSIIDDIVKQFVENPNLLEDISAREIKKQEFNKFSKAAEQQALKLQGKVTAAEAREFEQMLKNRMDEAQNLNFRIPNRYTNLYNRVTEEANRLEQAETDKQAINEIGEEQLNSFILEALNQLSEKEAVDAVYNDILQNIMSDSLNTELGETAEKSVEQERNRRRNANRNMTYGSILSEQPIEYNQLQIQEQQADEEIIPKIITKNDTNAAASRETEDESEEEIEQIYDEISRLFNQESMLNYRNTSNSKKSDKEKKKDKKKDEKNKVDYLDFLKERYLGLESYLPETFFNTKHSSSNNQSNAQKALDKLNNIILAKYLNKLKGETTGKEGKLALFPLNIKGIFNKYDAPYNPISDTSTLSNNSGFSSRRGSVSSEN